MIIKEIRIRHKFDHDFKIFPFDKNFNFFYSNKNSKGKTTFLRSILYALGFNIPNTKKVSFEKYIFEVCVEIANGQILTIQRNNNIIRINDEEYSYPADYLRVISRVFEISNFDLIENLLGALYVDQEKGWTLLNRGKIIGSNGFTIEAFLRGLNDLDLYSDIEKSNNISKELKKYRLLKNIYDYRDEITSKEEPEKLDLYNEELETKISLLEAKIDEKTNEINDLKKIAKENNMFINYIDSLGLKIKINGEIHIVSKEDLVDLPQISELNKIQINNLLLQREELKKAKAKLVNQRKEIGLFDENTGLDYLDKSLKNFNMDNIRLDNIIKELEKSKSVLNKGISEKTRQNNSYISFINSSIKKYWNELDIDIEYSDDYLFTHDLKSLSGAVLYKMIFAYKLSYIKALEKRTGVKFPIFIDSPAGREVETGTINKALGIIKRDFCDNQIFICSIFDYDCLSLNKNQKIVFDDLNVFDRVGLF